MHTFAAAHRPKVVYGRIRGIQRRPIIVEDDSDEDDVVTKANKSSSDNDDRADDSADIVARQLAVKENQMTASSMLSKDLKGKGKAVVELSVRAPRVPMQVLSGNVPRRLQLERSAPQAKRIASDDSYRDDSSFQAEDDEDVDTSGSSIDKVRTTHNRRLQTRPSDHWAPISIDSSTPPDSSDSFVSANSTNEGVDDSSYLNQQGDESSLETHQIDVLSQQFSKALEVQDPALKSILRACGQSRPQSFDACLSELEEIAGSSTWKKLGEASFSEVYSIQGSEQVVKVIPLSSSNPVRSTPYDGAPESSMPTDVEREIEITRALSSVDQAFIMLHRASIVCGPYPHRLVQAWNERRQAEKDDNVGPQDYTAGQNFALLVLADGGGDLESFKIDTWKEAASVFCQVVQALAAAEIENEFEHRDLHWGNIVVKRVKQRGHTRIREPGMPQLMSPSWSGVHASIIDFTLSRSLVGGRVTAHELDDEGFFTGKGDIQFDVYRDMRAVTQEDWSGYHPRTNVLWLRYLLSKLVLEKGLTAIRRGRAAEATSPDMELKSYLLLTAMQARLAQVLKKGDKNERHIFDATSLATVLTDLWADL